MNLYYFSGTGNSLAVARKIAAAVPDTHVLPIVSMLQSGEGGSISPTGTVGLVFPVHMNGLPVPVNQFLARADFGTVDYLFAVVTHGGLPGNVGGLVNRILSRASSTPRLLDEFFAVEMINNTPKGVAPRFLMRMDWAETVTDEKVRDMVNRTGPEIEMIIASIAMRTTGFAARYRTDRRTRGTVGARLLWHLSEGSTPKLAFLLDTSACTRCGICRDVCPSQRVVLTGAGRPDTQGAPGDYPSWPPESPCYYCYACFNYCPEQAVGVKHYTVKDGRYYYPDVTAADIGAQKLSKYS